MVNKSESKVPCGCVVHLGFSTIASRFELCISWRVCVAQWLESLTCTKEVLGSIPHTRNVPSSISHTGRDGWDFSQACLPVRWIWNCIKCIISKDSVFTWSGWRQITSLKGENHRKYSGRMCVTKGTHLYAWHKGKKGRFPGCPTKRMMCNSLSIFSYHVQLTST